MNSKDLQELEIDIYEAFKEIGDDINIKIKKFLGGVPDIYGETDNKQFDEVGVVLLGRLELDPKEENLTEIGRAKKVSAIFSFPSKTLSDNGFMSNLMTTIDVKDRISFRDTDYSVINVIPSSMLGDRFLIYKFECLEVENYE